MKPENLKELLCADLPSEAIKQHPTKTYLSSIKAIYVTERFNDVFGVGAWTVKVEKEHADFDTGMIVVKATFEVPELNIYYESFGGNDNGGVKNKNFDLGDAYKGATTDAITKIGSYLGVGIKVFKGLSDTPKKPTNQPTQPTQPAQENQDTPPVNWIKAGSKAWNKAIEKNMSLKELRQYYGVSKINAEQYLKEITKNVQS
jgi:hypothetical protein